MMFVGLDIGGSKSVCVAASEQRVVRRVEGSGSNLHQEGMDAAVRQIVDLVRRSVREPSIAAGQIHAVVCIAGLDTEKSRELLLQALGSAEPRIAWRPENDAVAAWKGAFGARSAGVIAIAGTGAAAYARLGSREARAGGWGAILGDEGSGYNLGRSALIAVLREQDGMGPATSLTPSVIAHLGIDTTQGIVDLVHFHMTPSEIAALAPAVLAEAIAGDSEAHRIVDEAALSLVKTAMAAARNVSPQEPIAFAATGGLSRSDYYRNRLEAFASGFREHLDWQLPQSSPVVGSLHLAMESCGLDPAGLEGISEVD